jgi:HAD superfamily hydrolase (TIGR01549 family)
MKLPYDAIIFDFDGVLADSMDIKTQAFKTMFSPYGVKVVEKVLKHHLKFGGLSRFEKFKYYYENFLMQSLSQKEMDELSKVFTEFVLQKSIDAPWIAGAKEFLEANYKDNNFYLLSGTPQKELELLVEKRNMQKYFKGIYGTPPEKPATMRTIISRYYYDPSKSIYIGDTLGDWVDAQEAGIKFIGFGETTKFPVEIKTIKDFTKGLDAV